MKPRATPPHGSVESGSWRAQLVGASRVHLHQHDANHSLKSDRGPDERAWCGREELLEAEAARYRRRCEGGVGRAVRAYGCGRGRFPQCPRPPVGRRAGYTLLETLFVRHCSASWPESVSRAFWPPSIDREGQAPHDTSPPASRGTRARRRSVDHRRVAFRA